MTTSASAEASHHLSALDGLRGVAAVIVVLYHTSLVFAGDAPSFPTGGIFSVLHAMMAIPLKVATAGPQAVVLFFVLSGFVLARAVIGPRYRSYGQFAIRRFFRIWPAFAVAVLASALLSNVIGRQSIPGGSEWLHEIWSRGGNVANVRQHLLMTEKRVDLDNVMWSLIHELRISFLFPVLLLLVRWNRVLACAASIAIMFTACHFSPTFQQRVALQSYVETASYLFLFVFGAALSIAMREDGGARRYGWPVASFAMIIFVVLLIAGPADTAHVASLGDGLRLLACGVGATGVIFVTLKSGFQAVFASRPIRFLGRVSYSLYLLHVIVLASVLNGLAGRFAIGVSALVALLLMLPLAHLYQRLVEGPTDRWGRRIAEAFSERAARVGGSTLAA